nr:hypothetical protein [Spirochaeta sp.]
MKIGLTGRLVLSHAAVALVAVVVFSAVLISTTGRQAVETGVAIDRATAERLAPWIEEYYRNERTWDGLDEVITPGTPRGGPPREIPMMPGMSGMSGAPMMGARRAQPTIPRLLERPILIVDATGGVLASRGVTSDEMPE